MIRIRMCLTIVWMCLLAPNTANAQIQVLSKGNTTLHWRDAQLGLLKQQLADGQLDNQLRRELEAQHNWLSQWKPGAMTAHPFMAKTAGKQPQKLVEPEIDPNGLAQPMRARLFGPMARPTSRDTFQLQEALAKHGHDIGIRQLHLHWLDQPQYRTQYYQEIVEAASRVIELLETMQPQTRALELARAFALYRRGRATLTGITEQADAKSTTDEVPRDRLRTDFREIVALVGSGNREFAMLEVEVLREDKWFGQALQLVEQFDSATQSQQFLSLRRDLLRELKWEAPYEEAKRIQMRAIPAP